LPEANASLGAIHADFDYNWKEAERRYQLAIKGNYTTAHKWFSLYLALMGRSKEAIEVARRARELEPGAPWVWSNEGVALYFEGSYKEAAKVYEHIRDTGRESGPAHTMLARIYGAQGRHDEAIEQARLGRQLLGNRPDALDAHAYALAVAGMRREALEVLDTLRKLEPTPHFSIAYVYVGLGQKEDALESLRKALADRAWQMGMLNVECAFNDLKSDPGFQAILKEVNLEATPGRCPRPD
jgi:tetratricopeptide (TPR) repeat protein